MHISTTCDHRHFIIDHSGQKCFVHIGLDIIVAINKTKVFALGNIDTGISGRGQSAVLLMYNADAGITVCPSVAKLTTRVSRSIINKNNL